MKPTWQTYEEVALHVLGSIASELNLGTVEGKQLVSGATTTNWEIDAKAYLRDSRAGFLIIECRRYPRSRVTQEEVAGLAFRIRDTGAKGGLIVSPLGLQRGARLVAAQEAILEIRLDAHSTTTDFVVEFLDKMIWGMSPMRAAAMFW